MSTSSPNPVAAFSNEPPRHVLDGALEAAGIGTWRYSFADGISEYNERAQWLYGLDASRIHWGEAGISGLLHPDDVVVMEDATRAACDPAGSGRYAVEYRVRRLEGGWRWLGVWALVQFEGEGDARRPTWMIGASRDITDRKRGEMFLDAQKQSLEMVVSGAPLGDVLAYLTQVVEQQSDGQAVASILFLDEGGRLRNGASPGLPAHYLDAINGLKAEPGLGTCSAAAATARMVITPDIDADPKWQPIKHLPLALGLRAAWSQPIVAHDGRVLGTFGTYFRERREPLPGERQAVEILSRTAALAIERTRAEERLREADRHKDEFLAMLSHELRNPLAPLRTALHMLRDGSPGLSERLRSTMERQVNQLVRLVDDLLEVSRISRGTLELRRERADIASIVALAIETSEPLLQASNHQLTVSIGEEPIWVDGDPSRLSQILSNLLNNAAKYTDPGGRIDVAVTAGGGEVEIAVRDSGAGIAPETMARLFEMFARGARTEGRHRGGLGIGLALARRLAELHGGTLVAASDGPGKGSVFTLRLPTVVPEAADALLGDQIGTPLPRP